MFSFGDPVLMFFALASLASLLAWAMVAQELLAGRRPLRLREGVGEVGWDHWTLMAAMMVWIVVDAGLATAAGIASALGVEVVALGSREPGDQEDRLRSIPERVRGQEPGRPVRAAIHRARLEHEIDRSGIPP